MLDKSKYKNHYTIILVTVGLAIWSYNIFQFMEITESEERVITKKPAVNTARVNLEIQETVSYSFSGNYRNPFSYSNLTKSERNGLISKPTPAESVKKAKPKEIKLPAIELTGIIEQTAIIKMPDNAIHFLEMGQELKELQIREVWEDSITIFYKNKSFTLKISN